MEDLRKTPVERIALVHFEDIAAGSQDTTGEKDRMIPCEGGGTAEGVRSDIAGERLRRLLFDGAYRGGIWRAVGSSAKRLSGDTKTA